MRIAEPAADDYDRWVDRLADPLRAGHAYRHLLSSGADALDAVVRGLGAAAAPTRRHCARVLDRLVDETSYPALIRLLDDDDPLVRVEAAHALACDRCKSDGGRPAADTVLAKAIVVLAGDDDAHVRARAVELVGRFVHTHPAAEHALVQSARTDVSPAVRKKARWYAPGGTIHAKTRPTAGR